MTDVKVGDKACWEESGEKHIFIVRKIVEYNDGVRWVHGSQTTDGEITIIVPVAGLKKP